MLINDGFDDLFQSFPEVQVGERKEEIVRETKARVDTKKRGNSSRLTCLEDKAK